MLLSKEQVSKSIEWLRANAPPAVEYLTHRDLLRADPKTRKMKSLRRAVQSAQHAKEIFSKQKLDGSWFSEGSWTAKPGYCQKDDYTLFAEIRHNIMASDDPGRHGLRSE